MEIILIELDGGSWTTELEDCDELPSVVNTVGGGRSFLKWNGPHPRFPKDRRPVYVAHTARLITRPFFRKHSQVAPSENRDMENRYNIMIARAETGDVVAHYLGCPLESLNSLIDLLDGTL